MNESNNNPTHPEDEPLRYFVPGELIVAVNHTKEFSREKFVDDPVFSLENDDSADLLLNKLEELRLSPDELNIVQAASDFATDYLRNRKRVRTTLRESAPFVQGKGTSYMRLKFEAIDDEALIYLAGELELRAKSRAIHEETEQKVVGVSLNWLWSSAPDTGTSGGPGSLPVSPKPPLPNEKNDYEFGTWERVFKPPILNDIQSPVAQKARDKLNERLSDQATLCPIEVIILDTIPPQETLDNWTEGPNNYLQELLAHLNSSSGSLHYYEDSLRSADLVFTADPEHPYHVKGYQYNMSDHGLFIAGIIHKIAPQAKIHMIEVLNEYAVGSTAALIWGLQQIVERCGQNTRLIVNSSLTISFSCNAIGGAAEENAEEEQRRVTNVEKFLCLLEHLDRSSVEFSFSSPIEKKYDEVKNSFLSAISVAAAGNDNPAEIDGEPPPPSRVMARFPAAYGSVIGVGALTREGKIARYSNKADEPEPEGFYVFGGNVDKRKGEKKDGKWIASKTDGLLGVYTHETYPNVEMNTSPEGEKNTSGWARWAGTSFASAVVTGILAQIYECETGRPTVHEAVVEFLRKVAEEKKDEGHVIPVGQGKRGRNPRNV